MHEMNYQGCNVGGAIHGNYFDFDLLLKLMSSKGKTAGLTSNYPVIKLIAMSNT